MKDRTLQWAPGAWYGALVFVLAPLVNLPAATMAGWNETKRICHKGNSWVEKQDPADDKMAESGPIKVSHKQL